MKNIVKLLLLFSFFCSCSIGIDVDATPGATKLKVQNNSSVELQNVVWNGIEFGNIAPGRVVEKIISDDDGYIFFTANNNEYRAQEPVVRLKHRSNSFKFTDNRLVINTKTLKEGPLKESILNNGE